MARRRSCGKNIIALARRGSCAAALRAYHKAHLHEHCSDARIGQVRAAIHACGVKGGYSFSGDAPVPKKESYAAYKRRMKRIAERARRNPRFVPYRAAPYERD